MAAMRSTKTRRRLLGFLGILQLLALFAAATARAGDDTGALDPILDLFVKKGFVTQKEVEKVKAEAEFNRTNRLSGTRLMPSHWKLNQGVKRMELFGDARLRYEDRSVEDSGGNSIDLQRFRYSLRLGLRGNLFDDFYYGFRLATASNPRSSWVTFGSSSSSGPYQGPFGKSSASINIDRIYLGWRPEQWANLTFGKMPNPLFTTPMVWDGDLNPEGGAERFHYTVGRADFFANFGQFLYADLNPNSASGGLGINGLTGQKTDNIFLLAWQGGLNYHITTNVSAKIGATLYNYIGLQRSSQFDNQPLSPYFGDPYVGEGAYYYYGGTPPYTAAGVSGYRPGQTFNLGQGGYGSVSFPFNQVGLDHLLVVEVPFEFNFKLSRFDAQLFGDVAYNLEGAQRAEAAAAAYNYILSQNPSGSAQVHTLTPQKNDDKAYQVGFAIASRGGLGLVDGKTAKRHAWELKTYWQHVEQYALDPNLIDSDFFEGRENLEGIYLALGYGFTDNLIGTFRYGYASRINKLLGTGGSNQDIPQMNPINHFELFQVDLTCKF